MLNASMTAQSPSEIHSTNANNLLMVVAVRKLAASPMCSGDQRFAHGWNGVAFGLSMDGKREANCALFSLGNGGMMKTRPGAC